MNYSKKSIILKQKKLKSAHSKVVSKIGVMSFRFFIILFIALIMVGTSMGLGILFSLIDTAPSIDSIDVIPSGYSTTILDKDGNTIQKLVGSDANRIYATIDEIPEVVQNAFIAIEDERFWIHDGIDVRGIFRAFFTGISSKGDFSEGASTITQQLLKNQVFDGGKEKNPIERAQRKIQEQYLAIQLESQLDKKEVLEYYLNTINLGQNTLGVQAASIRYFNKNVKDLTISEAAVIAGITQNPSIYNPISYPENNKEKQSIVLEYMRDQGYITEPEYREAMEDDVYSRIMLVNEENYEDANTSISSYFEDALFNQVLKDFKEQLGYTETQAYNALYRGGLQIYSTQDSKLQSICDNVLQDKSYYPADSDWQLSYRLSVLTEDGTEKHYSEQDVMKYHKKSNSNFDIYFKTKKDAKSYIKEFRNSVVKDNVTITGEVINYIIQPQVSFVLMDQSTGQVKSLVGGRGVKTGNRTLDRASGSLRQPGSTFKILSTYLPALDTAGMTLATVQDDAPYDYPGTNKKVQNWTGNSYKGLTALRKGIYDSMNIVTVKTFEKVTPKTGYDYLLRLGFTSIVDSMTNAKGEIFSDIQLPTALGGLTNGVTNLELTAAFAAIANKGVYNEPILYTKVLDHDGNILLEREPKSERVMKESTSWLLTSAMEDVVTVGTGTKVQFSSVDMPIAGKTGTTSNDIDLWFSGYTPYYTASIWGGYDLNKQQNETSYHKVLWKTVMEQVHNELRLKKKDFIKPSGITTAAICTKCGNLAVDGYCDIAVGGSCVENEYFAQGTVPTQTCDCHVKYSICSASGKPTNESCPLAQIVTKVYLVKEETGSTADSANVLPKGFANATCHVH